MGITALLFRDLHAAPFLVTRSVAVAFPRRAWEREEVSIEVFVTPLKNGIVLSKDPVFEPLRVALYLSFFLLFLSDLGFLASLFGLDFPFPMTKDLPSENQATRNAQIKPLRLRLS